MYKRILISAIAALCCLATLPCAAQVTIKFKSLKISNVTDKIWEPEKDLFCAFRLPSYDRGDVYLRIEAEIVNEGDTAVPISNIDSENMTLVYRNPRSSSTVTSTLGCIIRVCALLEPDIQPHSRRYNDYWDLINVNRFDGMRPLYYVSAAIPTMRLCMEVPGQGLVYSDAPEEIIVNGRKIDPDWRNFDYSDNAYLLVNNELMREFMLENPHLFGSTFSEDILMKEFVSHMAFIYHCSLITSPNN
ncbi:MAG: hypothetical protein II859_09380 [Bacteroidales bacterium]|nr:hypothetical protein [Bacteroidales bacterium]